jgi:hypothetical protein
MNEKSTVPARAGGCMCGEVRMQAAGGPMVVVYCHCRDCRASNGAPVSLFAGYRAEQVEWSRGEPKGYRSSATVVRSFCPACGTPLSYEDEKLPGEVYLPVGILDDPEAFELEAHSWASQRIPCSTFATTYPGTISAAHPADLRKDRPRTA